MFSFFAKAAAKYVTLLFALAAIGALSYQSELLTYLYLAALLALIVMLIVRPTDRFPARYLLIAVPAFCITVFNNYAFVNRIDPDFPWHLVSIWSFILPVVPFCYFEFKAASDDAAQ